MRERRIIYPSGEDAPERSGFAVFPWPFLVFSSGWSLAEQISEVMVSREECRRSGNEIRRSEEMANHGEIEKAYGQSALINRYLEELDSLKDGEGAVARLVSCGPSAVEPLRRFLLEGKPGIVYHTRRFAVSALAGLGARDVLIEYLKRKKEIPDPAIRLSEEAVESAAALQLVRWPSEEVCQVLIAIAQERCLPGALEALGELKIFDAVPVLVNALGA